MEGKQYYINDLCFFIPLEELRNTPKVEFMIVPEMLQCASSIDRVIHEVGAYSPISIDYPDLKPWYMHPFQEDNLLVCHGKRIIDLYTSIHGKIETFEATPEYIKHGEHMIYDGPCIFGWDRRVFHRVHSPQGSVSINYAQHFDGFDIRTNFTIYDMNCDTGKFSILREGHLDQK